MNSSHPINPPSLALIKKWIIDNGLTVSISEASAIASLASRLGADQELEACCEWLSDELAVYLRTKRRTNEPPSLKEKALAVINNSAICDHLTLEHEAILRRALELLDD